MYENIRPTNARIISTMSRISPILERAFRRRVFISSTLGIFAKVVDSSIGSLLHYLLEKLLLRKEKHLHVPLLISIQHALWGWLVDRRERINRVLPEGIRRPPFLNPNRVGQPSIASQKWAILVISAKQVMRNRDTTNVQYCKNIVIFWRHLT